MVTVLCSRLYKDVLPDFFAAAQRFFMRADNFFFIAGLIGLRAVAFFVGAAAFFGADLPFCCAAHQAFFAAPIFLRAAGDIVRLRDAGCEDCDLGGRPRRGADPSSEVIAASSLLNSAFR